MSGVQGCGAEQSHETNDDQVYRNYIVEQSRYTTSIKMPAIGTTTFGGNHMSEQKSRNSNRFLLIFLLVPLVCWAQSLHIKDSEATAHVGQQVVVEGAVAAVFTSRSGNTFLNFGAPYPNQDFSAVIFAENSSSFRNVEQLQGKRVAVSGVVRLYRGKPEIILRSAHQLRLL